MSDPEERVWKNVFSASPLTLNLKKMHFFFGAINVSVVGYVYIGVEFAPCLPWCHQMESVPLLFYPGATEA